MGKGRSNKRNRQKKGLTKNKVKERIKVVEETQLEGIDMLIGEIRRVDGNVAVVANGIENVDNSSAALAMLLIEKGIFTREEFNEKEAEVVKIRAEAVARMKAQQEAALAAEEAEEKTEDPEVEQPDGELVDMHKKAVKAGSDGAHPPDAFIFGG